MTTAQAVGAVSREAVEWYAIDWPAINRNVRRLQVRIVQATKASRWGRVQALQRLLTHSYSGKVLAVRRVTENNGKKTPGVDQEIWDTPEKKTQAVHALKRRGYQSQPLRRVYIPKSDGKTMRPLGIPTMKDRAQQALYLLALAPVVETTADKNSYGFRQQRSCADAMEQLGTGPSSVKPAMTKDRQIKSVCTTPRALPSNGTSRSKAKPTRTIQPMKPTSKNGKGLTCWKRFGVPVLFAISGMNNVDSARCATQQSPGSQAGGFITASPV